MSTNFIQPHKNQHYESLKYQYSQNGYLFEDPEFSANNKSLYYRQDELESETKKTLKGVKWLRPREVCNNPQFVVDGFHRKDIAQGDIGDCWFMSAIVGIAQRPKYFAKVVPQDQSFGYGYCGIFHFRFWQYGEWVDVVVDDRLPYYYDENDKLTLLYCSNSEQPNEYWPALLEKAYAKLHGSYQALDGGEVYEGITDMSGGIHVEFDLRELEDEEHNKFWPFLKKEFKKDTIIGCAIETDGYEELENGLINGHAYTVTKVLDLKGKKLIRVRNPYGGDGEWNGAWSDDSKKWNSLTKEEKAKVGLVKEEDGEFWMSYQDFVKNWDFITICHLSVNSYNEDIANSENNNSLYWYQLQFHSKWTPGSNSGGSAKTFWKNPQFLIQLSGKKTSGKEGTVIVSLMQKWSRLKRTLKKAGEDEYFTEEIQLKMFKVNEGVRVSDHKNAGLKFVSDQLEKIGTSGEHDDAREVTKRFRITPGNYVVVPSTLKVDRKGEFLVRVFTHTMNAGGMELVKNNGHDFEYEGSSDEEDDDDEYYDDEEEEDEDEDEEEDEDEDEDEDEE